MRVSFSPKGPWKASVMYRGQFVELLHRFLSVPAGSIHPTSILYSV